MNSATSLPSRTVKLGLVSVLTLSLSSICFSQLSPQILDSTMRVTVKLPSYRPADSSLVPFVDADSCFYYEAPPSAYLPGQGKNWSWESGTYCYSTSSPPASNYCRVTPNGKLGKPWGATANFRFDVPASGSYVLYTYVWNTAYSTDNAYVAIRSLSGTLDSVRYNLSLPGFDVGRYADAGLVSRSVNRSSDGAWMPLTIINAIAGKKSITVSVGADTLTNGPLRADALRILRSAGPVDLEFGRRNRIAFDSMRVPESFPSTPVGGSAVKKFKFFSLGTLPVTISSITSSNNQFTCAGILPVTIQPGTYSEISIEFVPTRPGAIIDTLLVVSNDLKEPSAKWYMVGDAHNPLSITVDQPANLPLGWGEFLPKGVDTSYYETFPNLVSGGNSADNFYIMNSSNWGGLCRTFPFLSGASLAGASGNFIFDIPADGYYLVYVYLWGGARNSPNHILRVSRSGENGVADSVRFDSRLIGVDVWQLILRGFLQTCDTTWDATAGKYVMKSNSDGSWMPLLGVHLNKGNDAATITWAADLLTGADFMFDAVRILRSMSAKDLEFGRREKLGFLESRRVPEVFPLTIRGETASKTFRVWSLGSSPANLLHITSQSGRFSCTTPLPIEIMPGSSKEITIAFTPDKEGEVIDTIVVETDDSAEPKAQWIMLGSGINWNFVLNASEGGVEPMWNTPGDSSSEYLIGYPKPQYIEIPSGWLNSNSFLLADYTYPIDRGNKYSRVYVGSDATECRFKFSLPMERSGYYFIEYDWAPYFSSFPKLNLDIITPARSDTQRIAGFVPPISIESFKRMNKDAPVYLSGGGVTTLRCYPTSSAGLPFRMDLMRVYSADSISTSVQSMDGLMLPAQYFCDQNYPNPFNPTTIIQFALPHDATVRLTIYDILGREARTLVDGAMLAGYHRVEWDGKNAFGLPVASGIYIYRFEAGGFSTAKKMVMLR